MFDFVVLALATFKLSSMMVIEQGPAGIYAKFRDLIGIKYRQGDFIPENWLASEMTCQYCAMIYPALILTLLYFFFPRVTIYISFPFALSTIGTLLMTSKGVQVYFRHLKE